MEFLILWYGYFQLIRYLPCLGECSLASGMDAQGRGPATHKKHGRYTDSELRSGFCESCAFLSTGSGTLTLRLHPDRDESTLRATAHGCPLPMAEQPFRELVSATTPTHPIPPPTRGGHGLRRRRPLTGRGGIGSRQTSYPVTHLCGCAHAPFSLGKGSP